MNADVFARPVAMYMTADLETARLATPAAAIARVLQGRRISAVPVVGDDGDLVGVVSRTDLVAIGAVNAGRRPASPALPLPARVASELMKPHPYTIASAASVRDAAKLMISHGVHRVYVVDDARLVGVICAVDIATAVHDARSDRELSTIMTSPIVAVDVHRPLSEALDLLERLRITGVIVMDDGLPAGTFSQTDALAVRDLPRSTPIDAVYDAAVICLPATTKLARAAAHVAQLDVHRVVVCQGKEAVGVVTALDFARYAATA